VRLSHATARTRVLFDDPRLVSHLGLVPVTAIAERVGLGDLVAEHVRPGGECGANPHLKVAGMAAGADSPCGQAAENASGGEPAPKSPIENAKPGVNLTPQDPGRWIQA
jgi:hypothetical protein